MAGLQQRPLQYQPEAPEEYPPLRLPSAKLKGNIKVRNPTMKPMFLPEVEGNPQPGPYRDAIEMMQARGMEYPQIWHMFAFLPRATEHLARFTQEIMREPAPLSPGMRELIAAFTSYRNDCPF